MESIISFVDLYVYYSMRANIFTQFFHIIFTNCIFSFAGCYPAARQAPARKKGCRTKATTLNNYISEAGKACLPKINRGST